MGNIREYKHITQWKLFINYTSVPKIRCVDGDYDILSSEVLNSDNIIDLIRILLRHSDYFSIPIYKILCSKPQRLRIVRTKRVEYNVNMLTTIRESTFISYDNKPLLIGLTHRYTENLILKS